MLEAYWHESNIWVVQWQLKLWLLSFVAQRNEEESWCFSFGRVGLYKIGWCVMVNMIASSLLDSLTLRNLWELKSMQKSLPEKTLIAVILFKYFLFANGLPVVPNQRAVQLKNWCYRVTVLPNTSSDYDCGPMNYTQVCLRVCSSPTVTQFRSLRAIYTPTIGQFMSVFKKTTVIKPVNVWEENNILIGLYVLVCNSYRWSRFLQSHILFRPPI